MSRDDIYKDPDMPGEFQFDDKVADVFDDMLDRSVPCYRMVIDMTISLLKRFLQPGDRVYDLGCSTGNTLIELAKQMPGLDLRFIGIDNSPAMLNKARHKAEMFSLSDHLEFRETDISELELTGAGAVIMNYTLQFIRPVKRAGFLSRIHQGLKAGGMLILSEKVVSHDPTFNQAFIDCYLDFKRSKGYSETEIARKRQALENVLIPFSIEENRNLLRDTGFAGVENIFQWFNFTTMAARKD